MGRVKIQIRRLETANGRQTTYSKRRSGLIKKTAQLATLCDVDVVVTSFSPSGKQSHCVSEGRDMATIVDRLSNLSLEDRMKSKSDTIKILQRVYKNNEHHMNLQQFSDDGMQKMEDLKNELRQLHNKIAEKHDKLRTWIKPENIDDLTNIKMMDESLIESLKRLQRRKEHLMERRSRKPWHASRAHRVPWIPLDRLLQDPNFGFLHRNLGFFANDAGQSEDMNGGVEEDVSVGSQGTINQIQPSDLLKLNQDASLPNWFQQA